MKNIKKHYQKHLLFTYFIALILLTFSCGDEASLPTESLQESSNNTKVEDEKLSGIQNTSKYKDKNNDQDQDKNKDENLDHNIDDLTVTSMITLGNDAQEIDTFNIDKPFSFELTTNSKKYIPFTFVLKDKYEQIILQGERFFSKDKKAIISNESLVKNDFSDFKINMNKEDNAMILSISLKMNDETKTIDFTEKAIKLNKIIALKNREDIMNMVKEMNNNHQYYQMNNIGNIDDFVTVIKDTPFSSKYNGNNKYLTISNDSNPEKLRGLFYKIKNATIKNLTINMNIKESNNIENGLGILSSFAEGNNWLEKVTTNREISVGIRQSIGGFVGHIQSGTTTIKYGISDIEFKNEKENSSKIGGFVGEIGLNNLGNIIIEQSISRGQFNIYNSKEVGGFIGMINDSTNNKIVNSYTKMGIIVSEFGGGLVGVVKSSSSSIEPHLTIIKSYEDSLFYPVSQKTGGLIAKRDEAFVVVENAYYIEKSLNSGINLIEGHGLNHGGKKISSEEGTKQSTFIDWDFNNIWQFNSFLNRMSLQFEK